jgi:hypothetical protein
MYRLGPLVLAGLLSSSSCITYSVHSNDPEPGRQATFLAVEVGLGVATGIGYIKKYPNRPTWQPLLLGIATAFALDGAIALLVWQADKKSD